jgi:acyl dehydratase
MTAYTVIARNPARASENRIHDDEVAKAHGFRGGLVPGVTVYAYVCAPILESLGPAFVERGYARIRFHSPIYEGDEVTASIAATGEISASAGGEPCAAGEATVDRLLEPPDIPWAAPPEARPPASQEVFAPGRVLGAFDLPTDRARLEAYLDAIDELSAVYREQGWVHPGLILSAANWILSANAVMPAWIHTESQVQHARAIRMGEPVEVRAVVVDEFERKGRRHLELDVAWLASGEVAAWGRHRAIWSLGS